MSFVCSSDMAGKCSPISQEGRLNFGDKELAQITQLVISKSGNVSPNHPKFKVSNTASVPRAAS